MPNDQRALDLLAKHSAIVTGSHFVYAKGEHGHTYVDKEALYPHTADIATICRMMAQCFADSPVKTVIGPAIGGIILSQRVAESLCFLCDREVVSLYAEKAGDGTFTVRTPWLRHLSGRHVLVVEDILTTGGSVHNVVELVRRHNGNVVGVAAICNRGQVTADAIGNVPRLEALVDITLDKWPKESCPLCQQGMPINTELGHGKDFLAQQSQQPA